MTTTDLLQWVAILILGATTLLNTKSINYLMHTCRDLYSTVSSVVDMIKQLRKVI